MALVAAWLGGARAGSTPASTSNLSPTPDQAADRHEQATRYSEELARKNQQAERKAMGRMTRSLPRE
jgi:hypothetical protein